MRRRRPLLIVVALAFLLLIALAVRWGQALTLATALAAPSADVWLRPPRFLTSSVKESPSEWEASRSMRIATLEADLGAHGRAVLDLVTNRREDLVPALLAGLPTSARQALDRLSPLRVIDRVSGRLLIAHGMADDSIPFTESLRLADAAGGRAHLAILRTVHHTGTEPLWRSFTDRARDAWSVVHLADQLLAASRGDH